jgi:predicted permease
VASRVFRREPGFAWVVVLIMAFAIGAATAIFSVVDRLLLSPLPYRDADRLVFVWQDLTREGYPRAPLAGPELQDLRDRATRFDGFEGIWANTAALTDPGHDPEQLRVGLVTPGFFSVLGADARLGRTFRSEDEVQGAPAAILLSANVWRRRYAANPAVVGTRILVNGRPTTIVGVMPDSFRLLLPTDSAIPDDQEAWLLLGRGALRGPRQQQFMRVIGRMKSGVRLADAQTEIAAIGRQVGREYSEYGPEGRTFFAVGLQEDATREVRPALYGLFCAVTLLLVIGCVNVSGLFISRATVRQHETAVRVVLGADRKRLFRQALTEGLFLSGAGGIAGLVMAKGMLVSLVALRPSSLSRLDAASVDWRVFAFACAAATVTGLVFAMAPLAQLFRIRGLDALRGGGRGVVGGGYRLRAALVVAQVAISSTLLVGAALLAKSAYALQQVNLGFSDRDLTTFKLSLPPNRYPFPQGVAAFSRLFEERLAALPGVSGVGAISHLPYDTVPNWGAPYLPTNVTDATRAGLADARAVSPGYFEAVGVEFVEGRPFSAADGVGAQRVAVVDTLLARRLWPAESALGKQLTSDPLTTGAPSVAVTVVGVVAHQRHREITRDLREQIYFPSTQSYRNPMAYVVKSSTPSATLAQDVRRVLAELDPLLPIYSVRPLASYTASARATQTFTFVLALSFAASALLLTVVGVFGVTAFSVVQRHAEYGLRLALGAHPRQVALMIVRGTLAFCSIGVVLGLLGAVPLVLVLRSQLFSVAPTYPPAYVLGAGAMLLAAGCAALIPALRVARAPVSRTLAG